ncbi:hypothetical protein ACFLZJ_01510 [Nanoarchaeota archaeon]
MNKTIDTTTYVVQTIGGPIPHCPTIFRYIDGVGHSGFAVDDINTLAYHITNGGKNDREIVYDKVPGEEVLGKGKKDLFEILSDKNREAIMSEVTRLEMIARLALNSSNKNHARDRI